MFRYIKTALLPSLPPINMACCTKPVEDLRKPTFGDNFPLAVPLNILYTKTLQVNVWCIDPSQREDCVVSFGFYYESCWQKNICDCFMINWFSDFFLIKATRRTNSPNLFCQKTLHVSGISFAHHKEFSTVHLALVYFMQVLMTASKQRQDDSAWKLSSNLHEIYQCRMYSRKLLMVGKGNARNM